jgi:hypothetical protein
MNVPFPLVLMWILGIFLVVVGGLTFSNSDGCKSSCVMMMDGTSQVCAQ